MVARLLTPLLGIALAGGCGQLGFATHHPATVIRAPSGAPGWILKKAFHEARSLGDPHPKRISIRLGTRVDTITLVGKFVCNLCTGPHTVPPRGRVAITTFEARSHRPISFWLRR